MQEFYDNYLVNSYFTSDTFKMVSLFVDVAVVLILFIVVLTTLLKRKKGGIALFNAVLYLVLTAVAIFFHLQFAVVAILVSIMIIVTCVGVSGSVEKKQIEDEVGEAPKSEKVFVNNEGKKAQVIKNIVDACVFLSTRKIGAIIVIEKDDSLQNFIEHGVKMDAIITTELIKTVFYEGTALHDGAMIICGDRIAAAACYLRPSTNPEVPSELGSRHRAALGISEDTDAYTIVVSEQRGTISSTHDGVLEDLDEEKLRAALQYHISVE